MAESNPKFVIGMLAAIAMLVGGAYYYRQTRFVPVPAIIIASDIKCFESFRDKPTEVPHYSDIDQVRCPGEGITLSFSRRTKTLSRVRFFTYRYRSPVDQKEYTGDMRQELALRPIAENLSTHVIVMAHKRIPSWSVFEKMLPADRADS